MAITSHPHLRRKALAALATLALTFGVLTANAPVSSAAGILPTTTTITSNANPAFPGAPITFTANVKILGLNLGPVTPKGTVTFKRSVGEGSATLGTVPLSSCIILLSQCTTSFTFTPPVNGDPGYEQYFSVTATFNGDVLAKPSSGVLNESLAYPHACDANHTYDCSDFSYAADGTAGMGVTVPAPGPGSDYVILIGFSTVPLSCTTAGTGDTAVWDVSAAVAKQARYSSYGAAADKGNQNPNRICWESDTTFTTASGGPATLVSPGHYQGLLPLCSADLGDPCVDHSEYFPATTCESGTCPAVLNTYINAPAGDPKTTR